MRRFEAVTLSSWVSDAPGLPMSVLTQPGLIRTQATQLLMQPKDLLR